MVNYSIFHYAKLYITEIVCDIIFRDKLEKGIVYARTKKYKKELC